MENSQIRLEKENQAYFYSVIMLIISGVSFWLIKRYKKKNLRNIEALRRNERILKEYACRITGLELEGE